MKYSLLIKLLPAYAVISFLIAIGLFNSWQKSVFNKNQVSFLQEIAKKENAKTEEIISGNPIEISIPSVGIKTKIVQGAYDSKTQTWVVSKTSAHFAEITALPNNISGNTLIYAHNTNSLFGPTKDIKPKDKALIKTANNHIFIYEYESDEKVLPDNIEVLKEYQGQPRLTILTCAGFWDRERRLMYFKLVKTI